MTKEEMEEEDRLATEKADEEDIASGRIRSREHLRAVDTLLDVLNELSSSANYMLNSYGDTLYDFINSKSIEELNELFDRIRLMNKELDELLDIACED